MREEREMTVNGVDVDVKTTDVFGAAVWLEELGNGPARAASLDLVEWQCSTWGSGRGRGEMEDIGLFHLVARVLSLETGRNREGRDELIVYVPFESFAAVAALIEEIGGDTQSWPWLLEDDEDDQRRVAASVLGTTVADLVGDGDLLATLGLA
jgi:hypothetical protein